MKKLLIITPVKDSIETAQQAISHVCVSKGEHQYLVYNDFSSTETKRILENGIEQGYELINLDELVKTSSPNYRYILRDARNRAIENNADLLIVESDVCVQVNTISLLFNFAQSNEKCGMVAAITVDENGAINFPYKHIILDGSGVIESNHRLSFCCTLLTLPLLKKLNFELLSVKKDWYDVQISRDSRNIGFKNYVLSQVKVWHQPHSSRPWKKLKYSQPVKYYFNKFILRKDRI